MGAPLDDEAIKALNAENIALLDLSPAGLMPQLARHLVAMRALSTKLVADAMSTKSEGARATWVASTVDPLGAVLMRCSAGKESRFVHTYRVLD